MRKEFEIEDLMNEDIVLMYKDIQLFKSSIDTYLMKENDRIHARILLERIDKYTTDKYNLEFSKAAELKNKLEAKFKIEGKHMYEYMKNNPFAKNKINNL